ncbi:hypothetical protein [Psychroflexus tropicus]|uniref:hypothetical protein n=1 Tax=Psychroflexus tropicus TaxID=197345 RepID=UPI000377FB21|nr:hypothetical protein [Psychroflexus tropicus]
MKFKPLISIILFIALSACKSNQSSVNEKHETGFSISGCPEGGNCTFEEMTDSALVLKTDGIGKLYPNVQKGTKTVLKFEYLRDEDPRIADDGYREVIFIEFDPSIETLQLQDQKLKQAKALFGRLCFCGNQAGYFLVEKGNLNVSTNNGKTVNYSLDFEISNLPQQIRSFSITN